MHPPFRPHASTAPLHGSRGWAAPHARWRQRGFTLIEAVISAGLLGFLAITATYFWVDGLSLVRTVNTDSAAIADGRAALERLAREIREVKYDTVTGAHCVTTMSATQMVFNKALANSSVVAGCGGVTPTATTNDIGITVGTTGSTLNLTYAGALVAPLVSPTTRALTSVAGTFGIRYLNATFAEILPVTDPVATRVRSLRYVELTLTLQPRDGATTLLQVTPTRTVVALRND